MECRAQNIQHAKVKEVHVARILVEADYARSFYIELDWTLLSSHHICFG